MMSDPPPPRGSALPPWLPGVLGGLLAVSLLVNGLQLARGPRVVERTRTVTVAAPPPMQPECPAPPACPEAAPCPGLPDAGAPVLAARTPGTARPPRPPPVDEAMAAQGEGDINRAAETAERDPVQVAAQRTVANGVDRIVNSRSPAAVRRFFPAHAAVVREHGVRVPRTRVGRAREDAAAPHERAASRGRADVRGRPHPLRGFRCPRE